MRLEKKHTQELEERKGLTGRAIVQTIWLVISAVIAYFVLNYLFAQEIITYNFIYSRLFIPRTVPEWVVMAGLILVFVILMQFFFLFGYAFASPAGRIRTGNPSLRSRRVDPLENEYRD